MPPRDRVLVIAALSLMVLATLIIVDYGFMPSPDPGPVIHFRPTTPPEPTPAPNPHDDLIQVTSPKPNDVVTSPLTVTGKARGTWYFEASFPVQLLDANGKVLVAEPAQAQGDWMTTEFVPFSVTLTFKKPTTDTGTLVLKKDNPSGLPEHEDEIRIPVRFTAAAQAACKPSGCSGQICSDQDVVTTCEFRSEYACYKTATCARQADGQCGWTQTSTLKACLKANSGGIQVQ